MQIIIKNIGMIESADIQMDGLTIIAGENDTGKSTVGKLIFSIVKGVSRYEQDLQESKSHKVFRRIENIYFKLRSSFVFGGEDKIRSEFYPPRFRRQLFNDVNSVLDKKLKIINSLSEKSSDFDGEFLKNEIEKIRTLMNQEEDKNETIKLALDKVFYSEFDGELSPKPNQIKSLIQISEGQNPIINLEIKNEKVKELAVYDELSFSDVTFIESSTILQMNQLIDSATTLLEYEQTKVRSESRIYRKIATVPLHIKDLSIKIGEILRFRDYYTQPSMSAHDDVADHISKTVSGLGVFRDAEAKDLYFYKHEGLNFKTSNTASGIKSFTLLQILLRMDILNERSLLILDEPENHLHPKWQVEYARIIVLLVQKGIPILITSHSPYIIQALRVFSADAKLQSKTHYYLASKPSDESLFSIIEDVTDDLDKVFIKLSAPLHDLVWIK